MRRPRIATIVAALGILLVAPAARGEDAPAEPEAIAAVRTALAEYDEAIKSGGADSVAAEKAVLAAGTSPAYLGLAEFLSHERFGPLVLHALCAHGTDALGAKGLAAYLAWPAARRVEGALEVASARTDAVRAALKALAADDAVAKDEALSTLVGAARVRAGDPESLALLDKALASKDPSIVAHGLLLAGDARATTLLARIGRFVDDKRPLPKAVRSKWSDTKTTTSDGTTTSNTVPVELGTLGEVALEAANRMCATTVPDWVAWWYEPEKGPRFGRGADGARLLKALLAEDAKAEKAKARRALDAVEAVLATLRGGSGPESTWTLVAVAFDKTWSISGSVDGHPAKYVVAPDGTVTGP